MNERTGSIDWSCPKPMTAYAKPKEITVDEYGALGAWVAEPKVDGVRITLRVRDGKMQAWSRPGPGRPNGLPRAMTQRVVDAVCTLPNGVYDGEEALVGRASYSWDVAGDEFAGDKAFFVFDVLETLGEETVRLPYHQRRQVLEIATSEAIKLPGLELVPMVPCTDEEYERQLDSGGEGLMLKHRDSVYRPGARTKQWLKVKATERAPLVITGYVAAIRGPHATLVLRDDAQNEITISTPSPVLRMADEAPDRLIGRPVIVKYQMRTPPSDRCPTGSYRHPRMDLKLTAELWGQKWA